MNNPAYYAILPAHIRYDKNLKPMEKILYAEITALANKDGYCSASNSYFAKLYEKSNETISRWISNLEKQGYLKVEIDTKKGNQRKIYPIDKKINTFDENVNRVLTKKSRPIDENVKQNNINIIIQENNNIKEKKETPKTKLTLLDLVDSFLKELSSKSNINLLRLKNKYERVFYELKKYYPLEEIQEVINYALKEEKYLPTLTNPSFLSNSFENIKVVKDKTLQEEERWY